MKSVPVFVLVFMLLSGSQAFALTVLKGAEAKNHIQDPKTHFLAGGYTYEILSRSHRDAMHGRFSDGLVFNAGGGLFLYPIRRDGSHKVVIDSPRGREEDPVTEDNWRQKIKNVLTDDNNIPHVFLDERGRELAVLYVGVGTQVTSRINEEGLLEMTLVVEGHRDTRSSGRRRGML